VPEDRGTGRSGDVHHPPTVLGGGTMRRPGLVLAGLLLSAACTPQNGEPPTHQNGSASAGTQEAPGPAEAPRPAAYLAAQARGFPALRDLEGRTLADGDFAQWVEDERLHVRIRYAFQDGRRVEERAAFRHTPTATQESWSWTEDRDEQVLRRFEVDFEARTATGRKVEDGEVSEWSEEIDVEPGQAFAGFGFSFAIQDHRERLLAGETVELDAVAFTPEPRVVSVALSHGGVERMAMAGRVLEGERFDIVPQIPWLIDLFVDAPDTRIWLTHPPPAEFLRFEGPLVEPEDPTVRIDLLPGEGSEAAEPVQGPSGR
jgi:hypothetical protein